MSLTYKDLYSVSITDSSILRTQINHYDGNASISGSLIVGGTLQVNGEDIIKSLNEIKDRLAILTPDFEKMEKFAALKNAYENYKTIERLVSNGDTD